MTTTTKQTLSTYKTRNKNAAFKAFMSKKAEIDQMLSELQELSAEHFNADPKEIDWADVGDLNRAAELLRQTNDILE